MPNAYRSRHTHHRPLDGLIHMGDKYSRLPPYRPLRRLACSSSLEHGRENLLRPGHHDRILRRIFHFLILHSRLREIFRSGPFRHMAHLRRHDSVLRLVFLCVWLLARHQAMALSRRFGSPARCMNQRYKIKNCRKFHKKSQNFWSSRKKVVILSPGECYTTCSLRIPPDLDRSKGSRL